MIDETSIHQIEDYFSDELTENESLNLLKMIEESEYLKQYFEDSRKLWNFMGSVDMIEPSDDFIFRFWKNVSDEEAKKSRSYFPINFINRKWAFAASFAVFLLLSTIIVNNFVLEEEKSGYVYDDNDELIVDSLEEALSKNTPEGLNVYGPWDELEN